MQVNCCDSDFEAFLGSSDLYVYIAPKLMLDVSTFDQI